MITIVFCHPKSHSFNHRILESITKSLSDEGHEYDVIDLYGENFNPVLDSTGLDMMERGQYNDPKALRYADALKNTSEIVFIFPIWWGSMPAMLKGFIDKTFAKGVVYDTTPEGALMPCLSIDKTTVVTTSEADSEIFGNYIMGYLTPLTFANVGMNAVRWFNLDHISEKSDAQRLEFIDRVTEAIAV